MPMILCPNCGFPTNTAFCAHWEPKGKCNLRIEGNMWVLGCSKSIAPYETRYLGTTVTVNDRVVPEADIRKAVEELRKQRNCCMTERSNHGPETTE